MSSVSNSFLDSLSGATDTSKTTDRLGSDKETFLKLLVAQLTHQDPLNPTDDTEFISQLAQFTSLEQLQGINEGMGSLNSTMQESQILSAAGFIGKEVMAKGSTISSIGDYLSNIYFTIDSAAADVSITIRNEQNVVIYSGSIGGRSAGTWNYPWDGTDNNGLKVPNGYYSFSITCQDADGRPVLPSAEVGGYVVGVEYYDGVPSLILSDGRSVAFNDVTQIYDPTILNGGSGDGDGTTDPGDGDDDDDDTTITDPGDGDDDDDDDDDDAIVTP